MSKDKRVRIRDSQKQDYSVRKVDVDYSALPVCWQFCSMDMSGPFSCAGITFDEWQLILSKMRQWEKMTWYEIAGRRDHAIDVDNLSSEAKKRLIELQLDDIDEVFSLHIDGKKRLFGIRDRNIFRVLWWDREHKVCPSHLQHT